MPISTEDALARRPAAPQTTDWKTFLLNYPWYPKRLLVAHFGIQPYDLDNWKRTHPEVRHALRNPRTNIDFAKNTADAQNALWGAWRFLFEEVLEIDSYQAENVPKILNLQGISKSVWGFLLSRDRLAKIDGYDAWISQGYTQLAFIACRIFPGEEWARKMGVLPAMFAQTSKELRKPELEEMLSHIYLKFLANLPDGATEQQVNQAKLIYCTRAGENSFLTAPMFRQYGLTSHLAKPYALKDVIEGLRHRWKVEQNLESASSHNWSAAEFRRRYSTGKLDECRYCRRKPVDLHHLLSRDSYPELTFNMENVVPLCTLVHSAITRKALSQPSSAMIDAAEKNWKKAQPGERTASFDAAMQQIHRESYDLP